MSEEKLYRVNWLPKSETKTLKQLVRTYIDDCSGSGSVEQAHGKIDNIEKIVMFLLNALPEEKKTEFANMLGYCEAST